MKELRVDVEVVVEMAVHNPFDFFLTEEANYYPFQYDADVKRDLGPFLENCPLTPEFGKYLKAVSADIAAIREKGVGHSPAGKELRTIDFLVAVNQRVQRDIRYLIRLEPGVQSPEQTSTLRTGSCRDSGWLLVNLLRAMGLAARFVSGYLIQLTPDEKPLDGPAGPAADFTDLHAWCEVYLPGAGWIGLDPTSGLVAGEGHIPLSCTPEPTSAAAISGLTDKCESKLVHRMTVTRIQESPRVTKPYTDAVWTAMDALGQRIDLDLEKQDVRLTMGGEPTFVSLDNRDGLEWNFTAVSKEKRQLSVNLIRRLRERFAPGALLHLGLGKWYPGEELPRFALAAYWRKDGVPIWHEESLLADESKNLGFTSKDARRLIDKIAENLDIKNQYIIPGYEDVYYYLWKERRLPANVSPGDSRLKNALERERLAAVFQAGLGEVVGYALPVAQAYGGDWMTGPWFLRDETMWLIPGDSPMGLRLPLDSLPWVSAGEYPHIHRQDPSQAFAPLPRLSPRAMDSTSQAFVQGKGIDPISSVELAPRPQIFRGSGGERPDPLTQRVALPGESAREIIRTALCVEPREGRLYVFMPPLATTEGYLELIAAIEDAAKALSLPVIVEGEPPPKDPRLNRLAVTPDPGVIEVNLHPSKSWSELVDRTTGLYAIARETRLSTEKFMLDGRHTGTGGGNHIVIGGATTQDSPLLRRPDLLRSLIGYWQNHPSLSWLFSGLFIGPTSQAPRIDEARHDSLGELEIAFQELERNDGRFGSTPPWLCDRLFRNLLVDSSGNTHRTEFSIDKLYSPEGSQGRLGLVEMRAFEMPPHSQMSLAQQLLIRGLICEFWKTPYRQKFVRWGSDIHDRWMLPHFCETDFRDVIDDLRRSGYPFEFEWFAPHFEFRFPLMGSWEQRDIKLEFRTALEPWHVLGEEPGGGGTVRYVDSSLERLQVKALGLVGERFAVTVNGRHLPLHPTGTQGEGVAGVRYRAWQPPECLQPTIGVHAPLVFDLYDTWNKRSLGGCTYHVSHPGGLSYSNFPINAFEAESRRLSRFLVHGGTQGNYVPRLEQAHPDHPFTLDLRVPNPGVA